MSKFDPNKPHGIVYGDLSGRRFEQNGQFFTADGEPWTGVEVEATDGLTAGEAELLDENAALRARIAELEGAAQKPAAKAKPAAAAADQVAAQVAQQ